VRCISPNLLTLPEQRTEPGVNAYPGSSCCIGVLLLGLASRLSCKWRVCRLRARNRRELVVSSRNSSPAIDDAALPSHRKTVMPLPRCVRSTW
jgi:hypothetical protein